MTIYNLIKELKEKRNNAYECYKNYRGLCITILENEDYGMQYTEESYEEFSYKKNIISKNIIIMTI